MKRTLKKFFALIMTFALSFQIFSVSAYAAPSSDEVVAFSFTNEDFLNAAKQAYSNGDLSEEDFDTILSMFSARLGVKGENKVVQISSDTYDYYLNNIVWAAVVAVGGTAVGAIIGAIPGISPALAAVLGSVAGGVGSALTGAENGVIIRIKSIDISAGIGVPQYMYRFVSIREQ